MLTACIVANLLPYFANNQSRNQIPLCRGYSQSSLYMFERRLRAVLLQSVESKLDRTGESEMAQRETVFYFRSRDHPDGLLSV